MQDIGDGVRMIDGVHLELIWPLLGPILVVVSAIVSAGLIVMLRPLLRRHALALPNARSSHRDPTPQGGGLAVIGATIGVVIAATIGLAGSRAELGAQLVPILAAAAFIAVVGAFDDMRSIAVTPRLVLQMLAVAAVIAALPVDLHVVRALPWWIERLVLVIGGLWFVNLVNFMDGIDWMTVAEVVPLTAGLALAGMLGALPAPGMLVAFALLGATLGFAPFNRPVARLFLGDVGSLPIGLLNGWLLVLLAGGGHLAAALLLPLYYLADATITVIRRLANRERIWQAHRTHFYQRATQNGLSALDVVGRVFAVNVCLVVLALTTVLVHTTAVSAAALVLGAGLVGYLLIAFSRQRMHARSPKLD